MEKEGASERGHAHAATYWRRRNCRRTFEGILSTHGYFGWILAHLAESATIIFRRLYISSREWCNECQQRNSRFWWKKALNVFARCGEFLSSAIRSCVWLRVWVWMKHTNVTQYRKQSSNKSNVRHLCTENKKISSTHFYACVLFLLNVCIHKNQTIGIDSIHAILIKNQK